MLDFYRVASLFTPEELQARAAARAFLEAEAAPHIADWWERGIFPRHLVPQLGELGMIGANMPVEHGGGGASNTAHGLIMYELERIDSGLRSFASVQTGLIMYPILTYGSESQVRQYLPGVARGELAGCFALTEHDGGSDPASMRTTARRDGGGDYVIDGAKMWISYGNIADFVLVWARGETGIMGFIVPAGTPGLTANPVKRKMSLRASDTSELVFDGVRVPASHRLPGAEGLSAPLSCLTQARFGIAWGVLGALEAVYSEALEFAASRVTFGKPIAARQLVQAKLVKMVSDHTRGLLMAWRLARLKDEGALDYSQVSLAKRDNVRAALEGARAARDILGGPGITLDHTAIRHMLNLETVDTYEGTYDVHTLIVGRKLTGHQALG